VPFPINITINITIAIPLGGCGRSADYDYAHESDPVPELREIKAQLA
jgi:hypothetical protein